MTPYTDLVKPARDIEQLGAGTGRAIEHPETVTGAVGIRRLSGGSTLKKVPTETIAVAAIVLIVQRRLRITKVSLERWFKPGLDGERTIRIQCRVKGHNRWH